MLLAHQLTYPQLFTAKEGVITRQGVMIGGPDRRHMDDNAVVSWLYWQKEVQFASKEPGVVPPAVMSYFQTTKHLNRPPKEGDVNILGTDVVEDAIIIATKVQFTPPRFTWSHTALDQFLNTCACQAAAARYFKTTSYQETEATRAGNRVHKAGENYLLNPTAATAAILDKEEPRARKFDDLILNAAAKSGGVLLVEKKMCVNDKWKTTGYFDSDAWGRGAADIALIRGETANIWDRKTGKRKDNPQQLRLMILFLALYYPEVQEFNAANIWYKYAEPVQSIPTVKRAEVKEIFLETRSMIERVQAMWESGNFPARKSGLCRQWCPNTACPHCGR